MLTRRKYLGLLAAAPVALTLAPRPAQAREAEVFQNPNAINGTDPVAYFTSQGPIAGKEAHMLMWSGATWKFVSADHAAMFEANPRAYAPVFGGYCAYAVSRGHTASIDIEAWVHRRRQGLPELFRERTEFVVQRRAEKYRERRS